MHSDANGSNDKEANVDDQTSEMRDRRSMRMVWKTLRFRHIGLAFFWACSMLTFRSSILLVGPANTPEIETLVVIASFVVNMTALFAIASHMEHDPHSFDRLPAWLFCACIIGGISLLHGAGYLESPEVRLILLLLGSAFTGIGYGYFWGGWAEYLGRMHPSRTSFYVPVAFLLTAALFLGISLATETLGVPALALMIPLPILSLLCLRRCRSEVPDGHYARSANSKRYLSALTSLLTLVVASIVLSCLFGFVWEFTVLSVGSVNEAHQTPLVANLVVAVGLVGLVLYAHKRIDLALAFRVIVPVIVLLFAILPFFWETNPIVLNAVMSASYGAFDVIIWYMVASTAYDFAVSGFVIGAIVRALSILARLVGIGIGYVVMLIPDRPPVLIVGVSIGAVYALAMIALFNRKRRASSLRAAETRARSSRYRRRIGGADRLRPNRHAARRIRRGADDGRALRKDACRRNAAVGRIDIRDDRRRLQPDPPRSGGAPLSGPRALRKSDRRCAVRVGKHDPHAYAAHPRKNGSAFQAAAHRSDRAVPLKRSRRPPTLPPVDRPHSRRIEGSVFGQPVYSTSSPEPLRLMGSPTNFEGFAMSVWKKSLVRAGISRKSNIGWPP